MTATRRPIKKSEDFLKIFETAFIKSRGTGHSEWYSYQATSFIRNSARWLVIFPRNIPKTLIQVLEKTFHYKRRDAKALTDTLVADGRAVVIHKNFPMYLISRKRIILL